MPDYIARLRRLPSQMLEKALLGREEYAEQQVLEAGGRPDWVDSRPEPAYRPIADFRKRWRSRADRRRWAKTYMIEETAPVYVEPELDLTVDDFAPVMATQDEQQLLDTARRARAEARQTPWEVPDVRAWDSELERTDLAQIDSRRTHAYRYHATVRMEGTDDMWPEVVMRCMAPQGETVCSDLVLPVDDLGRVWHDSEPDLESLLRGYSRHWLAKHRDLPEQA